MLNLFSIGATAGTNTATSGTLSNVLSAATDMLTWFISSMGTILNFITDNPVILILFLIMLIGAAVGMVMRIWHSA